MTELLPFSYEGREVRTVLVDGEPWFVAADVAAILGYRMASDMTRRLDPEDRGTRSVRTPSGDQDMTVISEPGLYVAVLGSQVSGARAFKRWVTHDVLPQIRATGSYAAELTPAEVVLMQAQRLVDQERRVRQLGTELAEVSARVDGIEQRTGWYTALAYAKLNDLPTDRSSLLRLGIAAGKVARTAGIEPAKVTNEVYGTVNSYPEEILAEASRSLEEGE